MPTQNLSPFLEQPKNKKIIISSVGKHTFITDIDGFCITSSNIAKVGQQIVLPANLPHALKSKIIELNGEKQIVVPLRLQRRTVAFLFLDESYGIYKQHLILAKNLAELFIRQYFESHKPIADFTDSFISKLVNNTDMDWSVLETESQTLGYDFSKKRIAIVLIIRDFEMKHINQFDQPPVEHQEIIKRWKNRIELAINGFFTANKDMVVAYVGENRFVAFKAITEGEEERFNYHMKKSYNSIFGPLEKSALSELNIGFSNPHFDLRGLKRSFYEAELAATLGPKITEIPTSHHFNDLGILQILAEKNPKERARSVKEIFGKLKDEDLYKTLEMYFKENLNLAQTAKKLKIHRNTAIYRLNQISTILNLDPRSFTDAVTLQVALLIKKYLSSTN